MAVSCSSVRSSPCSGDISGRRADVGDSGVPNVPLAIPVKIQLNLTKVAKPQLGRTEELQSFTAEYNQVSILSEAAQAQLQCEVSPGLFRVQTL